MTVTAADRDRLVRGSYASAAEVAAMPDALVRRLLDLMDARADVARDYEQER